MTTVRSSASSADSEQRVDLSGIDWNAYVAISDALPETRGFRLIYLDAHFLGGSVATTPARGRFR